MFSAQPVLRGAVQSAFLIPHSAFKMAARVGLAPTPNGLTGRRATLTLPGNGKLALPAGGAPASFRLEGGCLMYSTTAAIAKPRLPRAKAGRNDRIYRERIIRRRNRHGCVECRRSPFVFLWQHRFRNVETCPTSSLLNSSLQHRKALRRHFE